MMSDQRLIEDYLPIEAISKEASREKSVRKGHISTLHLWWARRPLVACRAALYASLVPADRFAPKNGPENKRRSLARANAAKFVTRLCKYPGDSKVIAEAQEHILEAHAERLSRELAEAKHSGQWPAWAEEFRWAEDRSAVTPADIEAGRAPRPRVLDMFAGGGAIPLEALRLGCEAYAMDLNPVAHIIELCTLVYPQKYGRRDPTALGMTGPPRRTSVPACADNPPDREPSPDRASEDACSTWGGLAEEVRCWGQWVLREVKKQIGDLYPPVPDPDYERKRPEIELDRARGNWVVKDGQTKHNSSLFDEEAADSPVPPGYLVPVAYLWTRTVRCKNPACGVTVPLVRQTWLCKKKGRYVALRMIAPPGEKRVRFEVVESTTEKGLGFNPAGFSKAGNATCPFCGTVADSSYVKEEGKAGRMGTQPMGIVCTRPGKKGKVYLSADQLPSPRGRGAGGEGILPDEAAIRGRIAELCQRTGLTVPDEPIINDAKNANFCILYGLDQFSKLFTPRQMLCLLTFTAAVREANQQMLQHGYSADQANAVTTCLGVLTDKISTRSNTLCPWDNKKLLTVQCFGRQALPMLWDSSEANPLANASGAYTGAIQGTTSAIRSCVGSAIHTVVVRGSASAVPWPETHFDAVITDPPYYDNVPYADISDFFYVWLKRSIGRLYPEHFATALTPKKQEAVADATRHGGDKAKAVRAYEDRMAQSLAEAYRVLKPGGTLAVVYAHKTTLGWSTLVDAFRRAGITITEAWPLDTEGYRLRALNSAALASSIFLVGRKREGALTPGPSPGGRGQSWGASPGGRVESVGAYETQVQRELERIVRERVETLWDQGVSGADLVIACVGAGLRAFTRYERVEYANGEEVPAERFLAEVETVVLETILNRLSQEAGARGTRHDLAGVDPATRFYILWRYTYRWAELDAGEAIVFANGTHVELDGPGSLSYGSRPLVAKKKGKYRLLDFQERGGHEKLGLPGDGQPAPLIHALHRTLWLMENRPPLLAEFLREAQPNREQMRLVAQALAGPALKGGQLADVSPTGELASLAKLTANWKAVIEDNVFTAAEQADRRRGQQRLFD